MTDSRPKLLDVAQALATLRERTSTADAAEEVGVDESFNRILALDIHSDVDIPAHDQSLVDGYAFSSASVASATRKSPVSLEVIGDLYPSSSPDELTVRIGEAVYVATGAPLPDHADCVAMVENVKRSGSHVSVFRRPALGEFVAKRGEDIQKGLILRKGNLLRAQDVGALRGIGRRTVWVLREPIVGILSVGDELVEQASGDSTMILGNYALILALLLRDLPVTVEVLGICPDSLESVRHEVKEALNTVDLLITTGGTSAGAKDIVVDALSSLKEEESLHWGLRLRPGHTTALGMAGGKPTVALPGVIMPVVAGYFALVVPLLEHLCGLPKDSLLTQVPATLDSDLKKRNALCFQPMKLSRSEEGLIATPVGGGAGLISRLLGSDGFFLIPPRTQHKQGQTVLVTFYASDALKTLKVM